jgi:hypothetical protein
VDIAKGPTQGNRFFKSEVSERTLAIRHRMVPVRMEIRITEARILRNENSSAKASNWFRIGQVTIRCTVSEAGDAYSASRSYWIPQ